MDINKNWCPITDNECKKSLCAWYLIQHNCCSVALGFWSLDEVRRSFADTNRKLQQTADILRKMK